MNKKVTGMFTSGALLSSLMLLPATGVAEDALVTGNAGILSDYIFRGIHQDSGVGNGGLDLDYKGLYVGTWIADVGEGIEYDLYGGYIYEFENGMYLGAGYTSYQYSDNFDEEYNEVNIYAGATFATSVGDFTLDLEYSNGDYNGEFLDDNGSVEGDDYDFIAATLGFNGAYLTYGDFGSDADEALGKYYEIGYSMELGGLELLGAVVHTMDSQVIDNDNNNETKAYVSISWGFDVI